MNLFNLDPAHVWLTNHLHASRSTSPDLSFKVWPSFCPHETILTVNSDM